MSRLLSQSKIFTEICMHAKKRETFVVALLNVPFDRASPKSENLERPQMNRVELRVVPYVIFSEAFVFWIKMSWSRIFIYRTRNNIQMHTKCREKLKKKTQFPISCVRFFPLENQINERADVFFFFALGIWCWNRMIPRHFVSIKQTLLSFVT